MTFPCFYGTIIVWYSVPGYYQYAGKGADCFVFADRENMDARKGEEMKIDQISGKRQYDFVSQFQYVREAGTEAEERAAAQIQEYLKDFGAESRQELFSFEDWREEDARLIVTAPYQKEYRMTVCWGCGNTPEDGVEAPFLYVENGDLISLSHAQGKIVMINNPAGTPIKKEVYKRLLDTGVVGFAGITGTPLDTGEDLIPPELRLPGEYASLCGGSIHYQDAVELVTRGASCARLIVRQRKETRTSRNVIARIEGTDKADEILTLTAHFDSVPAGPGAYDNMSGAAIIMELCRYFSEHRPRRTMEFVWFGAEEEGLLGSRYYVKAHKDELSRHMLNMNVDLAGQLVGGTVIGAAGDESLCTALTELAKEADLGMTVLHRIWSSDSNSFAVKGVPALTLNRDGFGMHTRYDTIDLISPWSLKRSAMLLGHIAEAMGQAEELPFVRRVPEEFIRQLEGKRRS